eukprot:m.309933 g.309933  ORF g.309933 m.309933 type:complete len:362 (+) comp48600_c0_seq1:113-1198(+)
MEDDSNNIVEGTVRLVLREVCGGGGGDSAESKQIQRQHGALNALALSYSISSDSDGDDVNCDVEGNEEHVYSPEEKQQEAQHPSSELLFSESDSESDVSSNGNDIMRMAMSDRIEEDDFIDALHSDPPTVKGELTLGDLPHVEVLEYILPPDTQLDVVGVVSSVVTPLVVVQAKPFRPALDEETVLWTSAGMPIGVVFETFGPVQSPYYSIRFNDRDEIISCGISVGDVVYYAPGLPCYTNLVFANALQQEKGSDASWKNDCEPPGHKLDYSDDEAEREAKGQRQRNFKKAERTLVTQRQFHHDDCSVRSYNPFLTEAAPFPEQQHKWAEVFYRPPPIKEAQNTPIRLPYAGTPLHLNYSK